MYNYFFEIAKLVFEITSPAPIAFLPCMEPFRIEDSQNIDLYYHVKIEKLPIEVQDTISKGDLSILNQAGCFVRIRHVPVNGQSKPTFLCPLEQEGQYELYVPKSMLKDGQLFHGLQIWNFLAPEEGLLAHQAFILHSSFVVWHGQGILFTAPSGTGKSTQADLWEQYEDADIYNGDRTIVRRINGSYYGFGSPYAGSSGIYRNESAPICAIIVLTQAPENQIWRLNGKQAFLPLFRETLANTWNPVYMESMTDLVLDAAVTIPVFHLACRPDRDAVDLVKKTLLSCAKW